MYSEATATGNSKEPSLLFTQILKDFLDSSCCPRYTMNMYQLDGYVRALAAGPGEAKIEDWKPLVFGDQKPQYDDKFREDTITKALISLYNSHRDQALGNACTLPFITGYSPDKELRLQGEQWARGFMQGYIFWQDIWSQFLDETQTSSNLTVILPTSIYDEMDDILATISAVADAEYATETGVSLENLTRMFTQLPQKVIEYGRIAHMIRTRG